MNNKSHKLARSVFIKEFYIEYMLISSIIAALILNLGSDGAVGFLVALVFFATCTFVFCVLHWLANSSDSLSKLSVGREVLFAGGISQLIKALIGQRITLRKKIGEYYVFTTNTWFFPKAKILAKEEAGCCVLQGKWIIIERLQEVIELEDYKAQVE